MRLLLLPALLVASACAANDPFPLPADPPGVQAVSLLGDSLTPAVVSDSLREAQWRQLDSAHAALRARSDDPDALIWLGRRLAYLGYYREAIDAYTAGNAAHPGDARFLRHRGHRRLTVREFEAAAADLALAAKLVQGRDEVEPDGQPNARGIPTSTLRFNIWYHLGLAHFLTGDFLRARSAWEQCLTVSRNPDALVATTYWLYHTTRRLGDTAAARRLLDSIVPGMDIIENTSYQQLLLAFKGATGPGDVRGESSGGTTLDDATRGFGIGHWLLVNGDTAAALEAFRSVLRGPQWAAFGHIAAEAELARHEAR